LIGSDFSQSVFGIVMPKQWIYAKELYIIVLSLRELGDLDDFLKNGLKKIFVRIPLHRMDLHSINIVTMSGLVLTLAVINIIALLLFVWINRFVIKKLFKD